MPVPVSVLVSDLVSQCRSAAGLGLGPNPSAGIEEVPLGSGVGSVPSLGLDPASDAGLGAGPKGFYKRLRKRLVIRIQIYWELHLLIHHF